MNNMSKWGKDVKKAAIDKGMTLIEVSREIGVSMTLLSALINGRYAKPNYADIAEKVNGVLGTTGIPPRPTVPSERWCNAVRKAMIDRKMLVKDLALETNFSRDRVSLVINGNAYDEEPIGAINRLLEITEPVLPSAVP
ncbi:MAG: helix-turn-helix transcriptional regulator [Lachnospiraceae bacterium]|nr:helix-turn-helix transcriptional regulator [Lachnospiraceae bacterium]